MHPKASELIFVRHKYDVLALDTLLDSTQKEKTVVESSLVQSYTRHVDVGIVDSVGIII